MAQCTLPPGVTPELVEMSIQRSLDNLNPEVDALALLLHKANSLVQSTAPAVTRIYQLYDIRDSIAEKIAAVSACRVGCSHCCKMAVGISGRDAAAISKHIGIKAHPVPRIDLRASQQAMVEKYMGTVCPFLKKNKCSIYEVRPSACRSHFNLSAYPELCNVIDYPGNEVPNLDWRVVWNAEAALEVQADGADCSFGDIREFFPYGADEFESL